jgi:hypothetical protein
MRGLCDFFPNFPTAGRDFFPKSPAESPAFFAHSLGISSDKKGHENEEGDPEECAGGGNPGQGGKNVLGTSQKPDEGIALGNLANETQPRQQQRLESASESAGESGSEQGQHQTSEDRSSKKNLAVGTSEDRSSKKNSAVEPRPETGKGRAAPEWKCRTCRKTYVAEREVDLTGKICHGESGTAREISSGSRIYYAMCDVVRVKNPQENPEKNPEKSKKDPTENATGNPKKHPKKLNQSIPQKNPKNGPNSAEESEEAAAKPKALLSQSGSLKVSPVDGCIECPLCKDRIKVQPKPYDTRRNLRRHLKLEKHGLVPDDKIEQILDEADQNIYKLRNIFAASAAKAATEAALEAFLSLPGSLNVFFVDGCIECPLCKERIKVQPKPYDTRKYLRRHLKLEKHGLVPDEKIEQILDKVDQSKYKPKPAKAATESRIAAAVKAFLSQSGSSNWGPVDGYIACPLCEEKLKVQPNSKRFVTRKNLGAHLKCTSKHGCLSPQTITQILDKVDQSKYKPKPAKAATESRIAAAVKAFLSQWNGYMASNWGPVDGYIACPLCEEKLKVQPKRFVTLNNLGAHLKCTSKHGCLSPQTITQIVDKVEQSLQQTAASASKREQVPATIAAAAEKFLLSQQFERALIGDDDGRRYLECPLCKGSIKLARHGLRGDTRAKLRRHLKSLERHGRLPEETIEQIVDKVDQIIHKPQAAKAATESSIAAALETFLSQSGSLNWCPVDGYIECPLCKDNIKLQPFRSSTLRMLKQHLKGAIRAKRHSVLPEETIEQIVDKVDQLIHKPQPAKAATGSSIAAAVGNKNPPERIFEVHRAAQSKGQQTDVAPFAFQKSQDLQQEVSLQQEVEETNRRDDQGSDPNDQGPGDDENGIGVHQGTAPLLGIPSQVDLNDELFGVQGDFGFDAQVPVNHDIPDSEHSEHAGMFEDIEKPVAPARR